MQRMTFEQFRGLVKRKTGFDNYWYYGLCIATFGISGWLIFASITNPIKFKDVFPVNYIGAVLLIALAVFGLRKIPNRYKVVVVESAAAILIKKSVIGKILSELKFTRDIRDENFIFFHYQRKWWTSPYNVFLFYDEERFAFSVQGYDYYDGGFLDFGETDRFREKLRNLLVSYTEKIT